MVVSLDKANDDARKRLPVYMVLDTSQSMRAGDPPRIDAVRDIIPNVQTAALEEPALRAKVRISYIAMADDARVVAPLGFADANVAVDFEPRGRTNYTAVFNLLRTTFAADFARLQADGDAVLRPVVFFLTDGDPNCKADDRQAAFDALMADPSWAPRILMFGVGNDVTLADLTPFTGPKGFAVVCRDNPEKTSADAIAAAMSNFLGTIIKMVGNGALAGTSASDDDDIDDFMRQLADAFRDDDAIAAGLNEATG
ncbi:hypothetical protein GOARA_013_00190 [Gordonia araii NBRC 100433]|uniref:VWFA domain-containing protein n=1 Tax=Gordonia araii NBRC 100433 TaxID=1073574 RepID=G7GYA0_9ACTN|nr:hypothetical protein GOARA_013_00190 [Gordonia araii NBRC 100433]